MIERKRDSRLETMGSPALGHGSNCKLLRKKSVELRDLSVLGGALQGIFKMLVNFHDCSLITTPVAVVWCCETVSISTGSGYYRALTGENRYNVPIL